MNVTTTGATVTVTGAMALDRFHELAEFADVIDVLIREHATVELDLAGVELIDSVGLGLLVTATHNARDAGRRLVVTATSARVRRLIELTQVETWLDLSVRSASAEAA